VDLIAYSQTYRTRTPERQLEIDECLRRNLNNPGISRMVLFSERDVPQGTVPVEVVASEERITHAEWFRWVQREGSGIGLLLNADMYLDEGLALTRTNPGHAVFHISNYTHWTLVERGVRTDTETPLATRLVFEGRSKSSTITSTSARTTIERRTPKGCNPCLPHLSGVLKPC
jgi:hypothetical protein